MLSNNDDIITRQHAIRQFNNLGYTIIDGSQEEQGNCSATGRQDLSEVILMPQLRAALKTINTDCSDEQIDAAIEKLTEGLSLVGVARANEQIYTMLKDGIKLDTRRQAGNVQGKRQDAHKTLFVIDWQQKDPKANTFTLVSRFWVNGKLGKRCLDLVGFVNGLPFILLETADSELPNIFERIHQDYKATLPNLFWYNAFIVVANSFACKMGSLTTPWEHFFQWKRVKDENEEESTRLSTLIEGTCDKTRLLDIVENFTLFDDSDGLNKLIARNHQYLGVNNAIASLRAWEAERKARRQASQVMPVREHGKLGVFWHTQGSGKSYSMIFFVRKVHRIISNHYTFVIINDRRDLDKQIYDNFRHTGTITEDEEEIHAGNATHLKQLLQEKHLILFTLIQKFYSNEAVKDYEKVTDNENIIVIADEAHRTQYDTLAKNMRDALPRASFIGFTGTPLMDGEEQTRETFGDYVSIYNFRRAINDGVTVPLYYENHTPQIELVNHDFEQEMTDMLEEAELNERQEQRVTEQYARVENFVVKGERLDQVAIDIVRHFMTRGYMGKAMVVSINKITAVRTYNRVQEQWQTYKEELRAQLALESDPDIRSDLENKIDYMNNTGMAVVISNSEGDTNRFARFSQEIGEPLDLAYHQQFSSDKLADEFKAAENPLRIVFVCAMWMTGFDVRCLSTIYLDRPLKGHTLMQTIARANRVYQDKITGMIIDYAGTVHALKEALAIYAREDSSGYREGDQPIGDKSELVQELRKKLVETEQFCRAQEIDVPALLMLLATEPERKRHEDLLLPTINLLIAPDELKLQALLHTTEVARLYKAILPDAAEQEFTRPVYLYQLIKDGIYKTMRPEGMRGIMGSFTRLVRDSTEVRERELRISADTLKPRGSFDLLEIDLRELQSNLHSGHRRIKVEQMRHFLYERIRRLIEVNPARIKYMEKLNRAIRRYNEGCANVATDPKLLDPQEKIMQYPATPAEQDQQLEQYTASLVELTGELIQEESRSTREELSEADLTIFDFLTLNLFLSAEEHDQVKEIARALLAELRPTFDILDWQKKPQTLGRVYTAIEDALSDLPDSCYTQELRTQKLEALYQYVQERYKNDGTTSVA